MSGKYTREFLIEEIKRFVNEFNKIPIPKDFEKLEGYPSRKTFTNHFKHFNDVVRLAGYKVEKLGTNEKKYRHGKKYLLKEILNYYDTYNKVPTYREFDEFVGFSSKELFYKMFGSWNNALLELGFKLNSVSQYEDSFLESEFHRFVKENNRVPLSIEFNNSQYPSFWCYQSRFGSWNKAVTHYGYEINDSNRKITLDNGEICASSYEFTISNWLQDNNIKYDRNIKYKDFIDNYKGKMDCDYKIYHNGKIWYVEMAGFLSGRYKLSEAERIYFFKLKYKEKLLKRQGLNFLIIKSYEIKNKTLSELFHFLK